MPFQTSVNSDTAAGIDGAFASTNPFMSQLTVPGGTIAGTGGVVVGRFAWVTEAGVASNANPFVATARLCFVGRDQTALITTFLAETTLTVNAGYQLTAYVAGDFWCRVTVAAASANQKAFASNTTGAMQPGAAGATITGFTETPFYIETAGAIGELVKISTRA